MITGSVYLLFYDSYTGRLNDCNYIRINIFKQSNYVFIHNLYNFFFFERDMFVMLRDLFFLNVNRTFLKNNNDQTISIKPKRNWTA